MKIVDTNIVLRWLLGDHNELSAKAEKIVNKSKPSTLMVTDVIVAEIVYVLIGLGKNRTQVFEAINLLIRTIEFKFENELIISKTNQYIKITKLDFADCYLLARSIIEKNEILSFDNALNKEHIKSVS